ncbi:DUF6898 family protein [Devosia aurantiaca]|uniref:Serine hydroxymethyltransferase n=1 Tax=Devosia aurantiaca TaxID=2714858 RepID=A0A6M1SPK6_9HYPH|nr:serine hydroxymethyltransferase [Devosia aurantiaca]NGP19050.1 serine hydroxymethyltransferase [Devosia aurantiaca]
MSDGEVLFEFTQVGQTMRVAAIDVATDTEVIVITPVNAHRGHMQRLALAKLQRRLGEKNPEPAITTSKYA